MDAVGGNSKTALDDKELFFLVSKFLDASPCQDAAKVLKRELSRHELLPTGKNWLGEERKLSYKEVEVKSGHAQSLTLQSICTKLLVLLEEHGHRKTAGLHSLLGAGTIASIGNTQAEIGVTCGTLLQSAFRHNELTLGFIEQPVANLCHLLYARQFSPSTPQRQSLCGPSFYKGMKKHCSVLGHLAAVFCVLFDHRGERIITGADDNLIKIWSSHTGQLLATLRGHSAEVGDLSLSDDNTMIASGSLDKTVRVWCAQTSAPLAVLIGHQSQVTSVQFSPSSSKECRYLTSTGKDGFLCFWPWLPDTGAFSSTPIKFMEKNRMGDQTLCSGFSPGGKYFVTGGTDRTLRVYVCIPGPPVLQVELTGHTDRIMTVQFGHTGDSALASGSCDGTARIWRFKEQGWECTLLITISDEDINRMMLNASLKPQKTQVTMVGWESTDHYLVTAFTPDCHVRVWRADNGELVHKLKGHGGEVFVLDPHPSDSRVLLTAGHDGLVIIWDMLAGTKLISFKLKDEESRGTSIYDGKFSPDAQMCVAADSGGYLTLFGFGSSVAYRHPKQQFFHTDYHPLMHDRNHYVVDEMTQVPPHLLPPPYLVDIDGNAHTARHQQATLKLFQPVEQTRQERCMTDNADGEDYDEYMKNLLSQIKRRHMFRHGREVNSGTSSQDRSSPVRSSIRRVTEDSQAISVGPSTASQGSGGFIENGSTDSLASQALPTYTTREEIGHVTSNERATSALEEGSNLVNGHVGGVAKESNSAVVHGDEDGANIDNGPLTLGIDNALSSRVPGGAQLLKAEVRSSDTRSVTNAREDWQAIRGELSADIADGRRAVGVLRTREEDSMVDGELARSEVGSVEVVEGSPEGENSRNMCSSLLYSLGLSDIETKRSLSLWQNRVIIRTLDSAQIDADLARRGQLYEDEEAKHSLQILRGIEIAASKVPLSPTLNNLSAGRSLRSGRTLPSSDHASHSSDPASPSDAASSYSGILLSEADMWEESSTDSGDISDWTTEVTSLPVVTKRRNRKRRLCVLSDEDMEEGSKEEEEVMEEDQSGQSNHRKRRRNKRRRGRPTTNSQKRKENRSLDARLESEDGLLHVPPDWIKQTSPKLSPYLPQVGDIVVYCRQGHELYLKAVQEEGIFPYKNLKTPWQKYNLLAQEFCRVTNVRFSVNPPTVCSITLTLLSPSVCSPQTDECSLHSSQNEKITFSFKYHDMDGVLDFLILDSVFKASVQQTWQEGDMFQSLIDGAYWRGTLLKRKPFSEDLPHSYWQCYRVRWDDNATDQLSPWDMQPVDIDLSSYTHQILATPLSCMEQEWGGESEPDRIQQGLDVVFELDEAHMFREPVSLENVPDYSSVIAFPTDLSTIRERLVNRMYRRKIALLWEVAQMLRNAVTFNREDSLIVQHCRITVHMLWKFISSPEIIDPMTCYDDHPVGEVEKEVIVTAPEDQFVDTDVIALLPNPSTGSKEVVKVPTRSPAPVTPPWITEASNLLWRICEHPSATIFLEPVDTNIHKDYLLVIHTPMDLSTVKQKLLSGQYCVPNDFISDVKLIFNNAKTYNRKGSSVYKMTTEVHSFFETIVLDFLKAFPGPMIVYGTRQALGRVASTAGLEESSLSTSACQSISEDRSRESSRESKTEQTIPRLRIRQVRSRGSGIKQEVKAENEDDKDDELVSPSPPNIQRVTRSRQNLTQYRSESPSVEHNEFGGYSLRVRNNPYKRQLEDSESDNELSDDDEEEQKSDEEDAYILDLEREEFRTNTLRTRGLRKRPKIVESDESTDGVVVGEEAVLTVSRSGRVVKPTLKFT